MELYHSLVAASNTVAKTMRGYYNKLIIFQLHADWRHCLLNSLDMLIQTTVTSSSTATEIIAL